MDNDDDKISGGNNQTRFAEKARERKKEREREREREKERERKRSFCEKGRANKKTFIHLGIIIAARRWLSHLCPLDH